MKGMNKRRAQADTVVYLVGGGIASLAAAAFFIRDGNIKGHNIKILEESARLGGSLDAAGSPQDGYVMRGGRMLESKYLCTYDLFSSIPTLDGHQTVTQEIFEWNATTKTSSRARLFRDGKSINAPKFGLSEKHILTIERLELTPEGILGRSSISDQFDRSFFETDFWFMWCTTFAFQPWHSAVEFKRYLGRFTHMVSGFNTLSGIMRTVYNQFDSLVRPLRKWLEERGVQFTFDIRVTDVDVCHDAEGYTVQRILHEQNGQMGEIRVAEKDLVIVTLGSMTESSSLGSMDSAPVLKGKTGGGCWALWEKIATHEFDCGDPTSFTNHIDESKWVSFTTTLNNPTFFNRIRDLTGNAPGEGGLLTFPESSRLASIVLPHQPHSWDNPKM
jgi:oleate hydratase